MGTIATNAMHGGARGVIVQARMSKRLNAPPFFSGLFYITASSLCVESDALMVKVASSV